MGLAGRPKTSTRDGLALWSCAAAHKLKEACDGLLSHRDALWRLDD
jgi:hypothetical protein